MMGRPAVLIPRVKRFGFLLAVRKSINLLLCRTYWFG